jgi:putative membrane protein (TIGR04086 family)
MEEKGLYVKVGNGVFRATIITIIMLVILSIIMSFSDVSRQVISVYYLVATCVSIIYGSIYAARKNNKKGWLVGILVAFFYMLVLYLISMLIFKDTALQMKDLLRLVIALVVGTLSGMLGINL